MGSWHSLFKITELLSYLATLYELRASCHAGRRRPIFGAKLEAGRQKKVSLYTISLMAFGIVNPFS